LLERETGGRVIARNTSLTFTAEGGRSSVAIRQAISALRDAGRPTWADALRFAPDATRSRISKFQPCLPDRLMRDLLVRKLVDLPGARRVLGLDPHLPDPPTTVEYVKPKNPIHWVDTVAGLAGVVAGLAAEPFVALDVETTLTDQQLCLVQLGTPTANYLIDPLVIHDLAPLARLLADEAVVKLIHNAQFEQSVLGKLGMPIVNIVDTLTASRKRYGPLGAGHSLLAVARRELDVVVDKHCQTSSWATRPLTPEQQAYAALDVELLIALHRALAG
jgi:hypothetical protein